MKTSSQIRQAKLAAKDVLFEYQGHEQWVALERCGGLGTPINSFEPVGLFQCGGFAVMSELQAAYLAGIAPIPTHLLGNIRRQLVEVKGYYMDDGLLHAPRWLIETKGERLARLIAEHQHNEQRAVELPDHDIQRAHRLAGCMVSPRAALHRERWSIAGTRRAAFWALVAVLIHS